MSDVVVRVEGLGKRYLIAHQSSRARYRTLRDELLGFPKNLLTMMRGESNTSESFWALKDVSFEVKIGEVLGIIGRNGAGKSTLLKILSRITEPTIGYADIYGRIGSLLEVGTGFHPELTGRENIFLNGAVLGMRREEVRRKFDEIVDFAEVEKFIDTPAKYYSSGMYMRLAFAVAAHLEPEILVVDEVLAVGDAEFQKKCLGKMGEVARAGRTVLFVSHNIGMINDLCSRAILLKNGSIEVAGQTEDVTQKYLSQGVVRDTHIEFDMVQKEAYFRSLALCKDTGELASVFDIRKPISLQMSFEVCRNIPELQAAISVFNLYGTHIFYHSTGYLESPMEIGNSGTYELVVQIPGRFLVPGLYTLNVALHIPNVALFDIHQHVLEFQVEDTGSMRYDFGSQALGSVLVDLKWEKRLYSH